MHVRLTLNGEIVIYVNNYLHVQYNLLEKLFQNSAVFLHVCIHIKLLLVHSSDYRTNNVTSNTQ